MKITNVHFAPGYSAFYFDDQIAIKNGAKHDGFTYLGTPETAGFNAVRQSGECISILLELENGMHAEGDCAAVQYSGAAGRDQLFTCEKFIPFLTEHLRPLLIGRDVHEFLTNAKFTDEIELQGERLHTAIRYGLSQAFLEAAALAKGLLKVEVVCSEYKLPLQKTPLSLFGQSGDDRYASVDKMIMKRVDALPHGLINNVEEKLGKRGGKLEEYITWLVRRISKLRLDENYMPEIHIDVYGTLGLIFNNDPARIADYLQKLEKRAAPFALYIEGPVDAGSKASQIKLLGEIRQCLNELGAKVKIVADEWCNTIEDIIEFVDAKCCDMVQIKTPDLGSIHNTIEAVLYCHKNGVEAYQGGTCNETDISAKCCVHIAQATQPKRVLVKPGMGFDEGMTIVSNEMNRILTILRAA